MATDHRHLKFDESDMARIAKRHAGPKPAKAPPLINQDDTLRSILPSYNLQKALELARPGNHARGSSLESEVSEYGARRAGIRPRGGMFIPGEVLLATMGVRGVSQFSSGTGGHLVPQNFAMDPFASWLSYAMGILRCCPQVYNPKGSIKVACALDSPAFNGEALGETEAMPPQDNPVFASATLAPGKTHRARFDCSRTLIYQQDPASVAALNLMLRDAVAQVLEHQILHGAGGVTKIAGILDDIPVDEDATSLTYASVRRMLRTVHDAGATGDHAILTSTPLRDKGLDTYRDSGSGVSIFKFEPDRTCHMDGVPVHVTAGLSPEVNDESPATATINRMVIADWRRALAIALFGNGIEVLEDVYTLYSTDTVRYFGFLEADAALVQPVAAVQAVIDVT